MEYGKLVLLIALAILLLADLVCLIRAKQLKKVLIYSMVSGLLSLATVCVLGQFGFETLHINPYTLGVSSVLGIPGVVLMLALQLILAV